MKSWRPAAVAVATLGLVAVPSVASAQDAHGGGGPPVRTVAHGLDGPRQVNRLGEDELVVAEADTGEVTAVNPRTGATRTLLSGLFEPQGVASARGYLAVALGAAAPEPGSPQPRPARRVRR